MIKVIDIVKDLNRSASVVRRRLEHLNIKAEKVGPRNVRLITPSDAEKLITSLKEQPNLPSVPRQKAEPKEVKGLGYLSTVRLV